MTKFTKESLIDHNLINNKLCCPLTMDQIDTIMKNQSECERLDVILNDLETRKDTNKTHYFEMKLVLQSIRDGVIP